MEEDERNKYCQDIPLYNILVRANLITSNGGGTATIDQSSDEATRLRDHFSSNSHAVIINLTYNG